MPRVKAANTARCVRHGAECAIGGGSRYRSKYCERVPPLTRWQSNIEPVDENAEWHFLASEAAAKAERRAEDGAAAAGAMLAAQRAWNASKAADRCASRDGEDAELAAVIARTRSTMLAAD